MPISTGYEYAPKNTFKERCFYDDQHDKNTSLLLKDIVSVRNSYDKTQLSDSFDDQLVMDMDDIKREQYVNDTRRPFGSLTIKKILCIAGSIAGLSVVGWVGRRLCSSYYTGVLSNNSVNLPPPQRTDTQMLTDTLFYPLKKESINSVTPPDSGSLFSELDARSNVMNITQHEYLKEIEIIDKLKIKDIDEFFYFAFNAGKNSRNIRSVTIEKDSYDSIHDEIIDFINQTLFDSRIRNEFNLIYKNAVNMVESKKAFSQQEKDTKLVLACIELLLKFICKNRYHNLSNASRIYSKFFIDKLILILKDIYVPNLGIVNEGFLIKIESLVDDCLSNKNLREYFNYVVIKGDSDRFVSEENESPLESTGEFGDKNVSTVVTEFPVNTRISFANIILCQEEGGDYNASLIFKGIGELLKKPVINLDREINVIIKYLFKDETCIEDKGPGPIAIVAENIKSMIISMIPVVRDVQFCISLLGHLFTMTSYAVDEKELDLSVYNDLEDAVNDVINLGKSIFSSVSTQNIEGGDNLKKIPNMIQNINFKKNKLTVNLDESKRFSFVDRAYSNLVDNVTKGYIFYSNHGWHLHHKIHLTDKIKKAIEKKHPDAYKKNEFNIKINSSPELYGDGIMIKTNGLTEVMIDEALYHVSEMHVMDNIYRYVARYNEQYMAVVHSSGQWELEKTTSPYVSENIFSLISRNEKIKRHLLSDNISHADVTPIRPSTRFQYDDKKGKYLKINNEYFSFKESTEFSDYIEGGYDILPMIFSDGEYHSQTDITGNMYNVYRRKLDPGSSENNNEGYFLDSSIVKSIQKNKLTKNAEVISTNDKENLMALRSTEIDGAISIDGVNYLIYEDKLIKIISESDEVFFLGNKSNVKIYKNERSRTYYLIPNKFNSLYKSENFKLRNPHCITKRQTLSLCNISFFESKDISVRLVNNNNKGIKFDNPSEHVEPHPDFSFILKDKVNSDVMYYLSEGGMYFHVRQKDVLNGMSQSLFKIYGKNEDNSIDLKYLISDASVIKDFETKKAMVATPEEAMKLVFNLNIEHANAESLYEAEPDSKRRVIDTNFFTMENIEREVIEKANVEFIEKLFSIHGKKIVTTIEESNDYLKGFISEKRMGNGGYDYTPLSESDIDPKLKYIDDIFEHAFTKTKENIKTVKLLIENRIMDGGENKILDFFIKDNLKISNLHSKNIFLKALLNKVKRMDAVFNENDKSNIFIEVSKNTDAILNASESDIGLITGFAYAHDPLDRIYINTDLIFMDVIGEKAALEKIKNIKTLGDKSINDIEMEYRQEIKEKHIKMISNFMCHESTHVLGIPEDFFYHPTDGKSGVESVSEALARIELKMARNIEISKEFNNLSAYYFLNSQAYDAFKIESLLEAKTLGKLFNYDDYLRGMIIINNPDTVAMIISELADLAAK